MLETASSPPTAPEGLEAHAAAETELVIQARTGWVPVDWQEIWRFRELLYFLVWRDLKVRYKQTALGVAWAVLQPVFSMIVFTVIFGHLAKLDSEGSPYAVFVYAGLLPWTFFSSSVGLAAQSLVNQHNLLTKVYFPRLFIPTACIGAGIVDMGIAGVVYAILLAWYGVWPGVQMVALPGLVALSVLATLGSGYLLAAVTVRYRDFRFVVPFMLQAMMYVSPVIYPVSMIPVKYQWMLALNPMAGIIDGYRSAILGKPWNATTLAVSAGASVVLFVWGLFYFRRMERTFADLA